LKVPFSDCRVPDFQPRNQTIGQALTISKIRNETANNITRSFLTDLFENNSEKIHEVYISYPFVEPKNIYTPLLFLIFQSDDEFIDLILEIKIEDINTKSVT
jgi:hypothetical protein